MAIRTRTLTVSVLALAAAAAAASGGGARSNAAATGTTAGPNWVWWEAERPKATNFPNRNPFAPTDDKAVKALSAGGWLGAEKPSVPLFLVYDIAVPKTTTYTFYARKFWRHGPFKWRFDDEPWRTSGPDVALLDDVSLAKFVNANWVELGKVELSAGKHSMRIEVEAGVGAVAFDCFVLTEGPFTPRGPLKPGTRHQHAPDGWFAFDPDAEHAADPAALDLRFLNESSAGEHGFIQVRGNSFVHEKTGAPVRFWAVNTGEEILNHDPAALIRFARRLARLGVNMVRLHGPLWRSADFTKIDDAKLIKVHALVAALKTEGIYLTLSTYFPLWLKPAGHAGFEGLEGEANPFAIPFFNPRFQELQKSWWKAALTRPNPATGLSLLQDPTLAFVEIINEDGLLFWTFSPYKDIPEQQMAILEKQFGDWLTKRYGSIDKAFHAWGTGGVLARVFGGMVKGDDVATGRVGFMTLDQMLDKKDKRAQDTAVFLAEAQRTYFDRMYTYLKKDLGFRGSVSCSNWITADARVLGPLDKLSNSRCDFMDRHGYFTGPHEGERASYALSPGDRYNDAAAVRFETGRADAPGPSFELPIMDLAYNGKPSTNSEINWLPPNRFRADLPLLAAAYGALQGSDAFFFFATDETDWARKLGKFAISDPVVMGQFPATALIFRKGLVRTAAPAIHLETAVGDLEALKGIPVSAPLNLDELRRQQVPLDRVDTARIGAIDPLAFLVGPVEVNITQRGGTSRLGELDKFIDRGKSIVRSSTGELRWDYGQGVVTMDAAGAQGVTGFLSRAGTVALGDVQISSPMEYGAVVVVALDDQPIKTSGKLLIQVMSEDSNLGWSAPGSGMRAIADVGGPPVIVKQLRGKVMVRRPDAGELKVTPLDFNGRTAPGGNTRPAQQHLKASELNLLPSTFYYLVEKPAAPQPPGAASSEAAQPESLKADAPKAKAPRPSDK